MEAEAEAREETRVLVVEVEAQVEVRDRETEMGAEVLEEIQALGAEAVIRERVQVPEVEAKFQEKVLIWRTGAAAPTIPREAAKQRKAPATMAREDIPAVGAESAEPRKA